MATQMALTVDEAKKRVTRLREGGRKVVREESLYEHAHSRLEARAERRTVWLFDSLEVRWLSKADPTGSLGRELREFRKEGSEMSATSIDEIMFALER